MLRATATHPLEERWSRPGGPWDQPTLDRLLSELPCRWYDASGAGAPAEDLVATVAGGLAAAGIRPGDVVSWQRPTDREAAALLRACWRLGAVAAPVHHRAGAAERAAVLSGLAPALVVEGDAPRGDPLPPGGPRAAPHDIAVVVHTSGTSGTPKGVLHTHRTLAYKARLMTQVHGLGPDDVVLMPAPLAHVSGLLNGVLVPGAAGMTSVFMARWDPEAALAAIQDHGVTFMVGPPTFFLGLLGSEGFHPDRVRTLRLVSCGGAGVTPDFVTRTAAALGCVVKRTYGSTEAPTVTTSRPDDPPERAAETDGRAVGEAELRVVDGELWVRGPELFAGYLNPDDDVGALEQGWFRTGDLATVDAEGWCTITGRRKEVIIRAGENIATAPVEALLEAHPAVEAAVVIGEPDDHLGERVAAFVVATEPFDLETCRRWFAESGAARYWTPERIVQVEDLPMLPSGKPDRAALRQQLEG